MTGAVPATHGYRTAQQALDSGAALQRMNQIIEAQGARELPPEAQYRCEVASALDGRIREIDNWQIARVAKRAGAPANVAAGVRLLRTVGEVVSRGDPVFEIHAESRQQLEFARAYAESTRIIEYGY